MSDDSDLPTRAAPRARGCWAVWIDRDAVEHLATDLSVGGLFLLGVTHHEVGDRVTLEIDLGGPRLATGATVRWVRPRRIGPGLLAGCGLAFDGLSDRERTCLLASLRSVEDA